MIRMSDYYYIIMGDSGIVIRMSDYYYIIMEGQWHCD